MAEELITIKTSKTVHRAVRMIAGARGLKQYEVMEVLLDIMKQTDGQLVHELFAKKAGEWQEIEK